MTIAYPREWPTGINIVQSKLNLDFNQSVFEPPYTRERQIQELDGGRTDRWTGLWASRILNPSEIAQMRAFMISLKGQKNEFYAFDADARYPADFIIGEFAGTEIDLAGNENQLAGLGSSVNNGEVDGGSQTGNSLNVKGFTPSSTPLQAGDYFQILNQYFMALEDLVVDGSGNGSFTFEPAIRTSPADGDLIKTVNAVMIARMSEPYDGWETDQLKNGVISIAFEEVI